MCVGRFGSVVVHIGLLWHLSPPPQIERLEEEKLALRKRVVGLQLAGGRGGDDGEREGERERGREETDIGPSTIEELQSVIAELKSQVQHKQVFTPLVHRNT